MRTEELGRGGCALGALGHRVGVVRGDRSLAGISASVVVVTGASLTASETEALIEWVQAGGKLIWQGVDATTWGFAANVLLGAEAGDFFAPRAERVKIFGATWNFRTFARDVFVGAVPNGARVIAADRSRRPVVLKNRLGRGCVVACLAQPDDEFAAESNDRRVRSRWLRWYRGMLALAK